MDNRHIVQQPIFFLRNIASRRDSQSVNLFIGVTESSCAIENGALRKLSKTSGFYMWPRFSNVPA